MRNEGARYRNQTREGRNNTAESEEDLRLTLLVTVGCQWRLKLCLQVLGCENLCCPDYFICFKHSFAVACWWIGEDFVEAMRTNPDINLSL
jgi:hypothetical protein